MLITLLTLGVAGAVHAQSNWTGDVSDFWNIADNWEDNKIPPDDFDTILIFDDIELDASNQPTASLGDDNEWSLNRIEILATETSYEIGGISLRFGPTNGGMDPAIISNSPQNQTISNLINVEGNLTVSNLGSGDFTFEDEGFSLESGDSLTIGQGVTVEGTAAGIAANVGNEVTNFGTVRGEVGIAVNSGNQVTNSGSIEGGIAGVAAGPVAGIEGPEISGNVIINSGTIFGNTFGVLGLSNTVVRNLSGGQILGDTGIAFGAEALEGLNLQLVNFNVDEAGTLGLTSGGINIVFNQGVINGVSGVAINSLGNASDLVTNFSGGTIIGKILLGTGNDIFTLETGSTFNDMADGGGPEDEDVDVLNLIGSGAQTANLENFDNFENLIKSGSGEWTAVGTGAFRNGTTIQAGALYVDGNLESDVQVNPRGMFGGSGIVTGNATNGGIVAPGRLQLPDTLTVTGNYTQSPGGVLSIDVGGRNPGEFDVLAVGGSAILDGQLQLVAMNNFRLERSDKLAILIAGDRISGQFAEIEGLETGTILTPVLLYEGNAVFLIAEPLGTFEDCAVTPNEQAVARALDSIGSDPRGEELINYLDQLPKSDLPTAFNLIAPEELTSAFVAGFSSNNIQAGNLNQRMESVRKGSSGFSGNNVSIAVYGKGWDDKSINDEGPGKEMPPPVEERRWGTFINGSGEFVFIDGTFQTDQVDVTTAGFTMGADYRVNENFAIGIYGGYTNSNSDLTGDGKVEINTGNGGIYATVFGSGAYSNLAIGGGYSSYDTRRQGLGGSPTGDTDGGEFDSLLGFGYDWTWGGLVLGPTLNFQYTYVGIDGYTERGSLAPLKIDDNSADSFRSRLGGRASYAAHLRGKTVTPELRLAWQHEYLDDSYSVGAAFASGASSGFTVDGPTIGRDSLILGAGLTVQWSEVFNFYANYDAQLGSDNYTYHSVTGGLRLSF